MFCKIFFLVFLSILSFSSSAQRNTIEAMKLKFTIPKGFEEETNREFDKGAALGGPRLRLISHKKDVIIAINTIGHDTSAKGKANIKWIRDTFRPDHSRNQNFYAYAIMLADSINHPLLRMKEKDLKFYNTDYGAEFTIKDEMNPYKPDYTIGKAITMFKWKQGDILLFYFFKRNFTPKQVERIMKKTKGFITY